MPGDESDAARAAAFMSANHPEALARYLMAYSGASPERLGRRGARLIIYDPQRRAQVLQDGAAGAAFRQLTTFRLARTGPALLAAVAFMTGCGLLPPMSSGPPDSGPDPAGNDATSENDPNDQVGVGYGTQDRDELTGAVSSVRAEDVGREVTSILDLIEGRLPGVTVRRLGNGDVSIRVRGASVVHGRRGAALRDRRPDHHGPRGLGSDGHQPQGRRAHRCPQGCRGHGDLRKSRRERGDPDHDEAGTRVGARRLTGFISRHPAAPRVIFRPGPRGPRRGVPEGPLLVRFLRSCHTFSGTPRLPVCACRLPSLGCACQVPPRPVRLLSPLEALCEESYESRWVCSPAWL